MFSVKKTVSYILIISVLMGVFSLSASAISAKAAVVICGDTGEILYSHNENARMSMASTTKIMTAWLLCELGGNLSRTIVTTPEMVTVEGSSMGLLAGDTVCLRDLLYGMMLPSGNDAANTTAIVIGGSIDGFVELMNKKAADMGLLNTHFCTPSGLDAEEHYTTAYELALIAREALKNEEFAAAAAAQSATLNYGNPPYRRTLTNHNKLLRMYDDVIGVKTGFTKKSGRCLVSAAKRDGKYVIAVTLNDGNDWADHRELLNIGIASVQIQTHKAAEGALVLPIASGGEVSEEINQFSMCTAMNANISSIVAAPRFLYAPVTAGDKIAQISYFCNGEAVFTADVTASSDIKSEPTAFLERWLNMFKYMFRS